MIDVHNWYTVLPENVQRGILVGAEGSVQLMSFAQQTLQAAQTAGPKQKELLQAGVYFLLAAWSKDPLNGQLAEQLLTLHTKWPCLDPATCALLESVQSKWVNPPDTRYYRRLLEAEDSEKLQLFLGDQLTRSPENFYWWRQSMAFAQYEEDWELANKVMQSSDWPAHLKPVHQTLLGDIAWLQGDKEQACQYYTEAYGLDALFRRALHLSQTQGLDAARPLWQKLLTAAPWMSLVVLVCYDLLQGYPARSAPVPGKGVVAVYSYNKAADLDITLSSLLDSQLGQAELWVLNNGSTDATADVLAGWQGRAGEQMRRIDLPVNIGAPAARNWLMYEVAQEGKDWMAYVDDDVELPENWLHMLGAAMEIYPDAGVWGCKVVDAVHPVSMQSVDLHLRPASEGGPDERFDLADIHHQTLDFGQFNYIRPCSSVTGCCHLFRMKTLAECGDFDLRFSPSQFDDLEHDIRLNIQGRYAVYQGHLRILHLKRTGKGTRGNSAQFSSAIANMHKLQKKYSASQYAKLIDWEADALAKDFWKKHTSVMQWLWEENA